MSESKKVMFIKGAACSPKCHGSDTFHFRFRFRVGLKSMSKAPGTFLIKEVACELERSSASMDSHILYDMLNGSECYIKTGFLNNFEG